MTDSLPAIKAKDGLVELWKLKSGEWYLTVGAKNIYQAPSTVQLSQQAAGELIRQLLQVRLQLGGTDE